MPAELRQTVTRNGELSVYVFYFKTFLTCDLLSTCLLEIGASEVGDGGSTLGAGGASSGRVQSGSDLESFSVVSEAHWTP